MNSLDLCLAALAGQRARRVPVCLENFLHSAAVSGYTAQEYCLNADIMAESHIKAWVAFGHDLIDLENGVTALAQAVGCEVKFHPDGKTAPWVSRPALEDMSQVGSLHPVDPHQDGTLPAMLEATRRIRQTLGEHVCLLAEADQGPFSLAAQIVGPQKFLMDLLNPEKEEYARSLLFFASEQVITYARALAEAGAHLTMMGESIAGPDVCSPALYRKFALPYESYVVKTLFRDGIPMGIHMCGNATPVIDSLVSTQAAFLQLDHKIDRQTCRRVCSNTAIIGTVDNCRIMASGNPQEVRAAALADIRLLSPGGRFVLSPGCTLPYDTPPDNVRALVHAAWSYSS